VLWRGTPVAIDQSIYVTVFVEDGSAIGYPGLAHGASLQHELQLLVGAGLSPLEALR